MVWVQWTPSGLRDTTRLFSHLTQDRGETSGLPLPPRGGARCKASLAAKPERGREVRGRPPAPRASPGLQPHISPAPLAGASPFSSPP